MGGSKSISGKPSSRFYILDGVTDGSESTSLWMRRRINSIAGDTSDSQLLEQLENLGCTLFETNSVNFTFDQCNNTYFISKHYPQLNKKSDAAGATKESE